MKEVIRLILIIFFGLFYKVEVKGLENVPEKGPVLLCANHLGQMDMFFIGYRIKPLVRWVAKEELFRNPILAAIITKLGAIPIKRGKTDVSSTKRIFKLLDEGEIVGIFPEGTRTRGKDKSKITVKPAFVKYALESGAPVLPVALQGTYKPFSKVKVVFGKPFYLGNGNLRDRKYTKEELSAYSKKVMDSIYSLLEE